MGYPWLCDVFRPTHHFTNNGHQTGFGYLHHWHIATTAALAIALGIC